MDTKAHASIRVVALYAVFSLSLAASDTLAEKKYGPGVTDTEIKLGQTMPYSGPASAYSNYGKVETGYFQMINDRGGINGRKVQLISLDDGFSPPKTVEQTRPHRRGTSTHDFRESRDCPQLRDHALSE